MPNHGFHLDLPFLHEEINPDGMADRLGIWRTKKQAAGAEISDAGDIFNSVTSPQNPNILRNSDA
jgi:hypothetical protein